MSSRTRNLGRLRWYVAEDASSPDRLSDMMIYGADTPQPEHSSVEAANRWLTTVTRESPPKEPRLFVLVRLVQGRRIEKHTIVATDETAVDLGPVPFEAKEVEVHDDFLVDPGVSAFDDESH